MAKLGEAYVQIRADLKPFAKDLDREVKRITDRFENALNKQLGRKFGMDLGSGAREGINESLRDLDKDIDKSVGGKLRTAGRRGGRQLTQGIGDGLQDRDPIEKAFAYLISALEDGFSALPVQAKAALGAALVAAVVPAGALASAALSTALIAGLSGLGVALAFQFREVEYEGEQFAESLRQRFVGAAQSFAAATVNAMDLIDYRLETLDPKIRSLFDNASKYVVPFAEAVTGLIAQVVTEVGQGLEEAEFDQITDQLVTGFNRVGQSVGRAFRQLLANRNLDVALGDLLETIADLVDIGGDFLNWTLDAYADLRPFLVGIKEFVDVGGDMLSILTALGSSTAIEDVGDAWKIAFDKDVALTPVTNTTRAMEYFNRVLAGTIGATDEQEKKLDEMRRAFEDLTNAAHDSVNAELDYRQSVLDVTAALDEHGPSLDLSKQKGIDLAREYENAIASLDKFVKKEVESGQMTDQQAQAFYDKEIKRLRDEFKARGGVISQFDTLFKKWADLAGLPPIPPKTNELMWAADLATKAYQNMHAAIIAAYNAAARLPASVSGNIKVEGGTQIKFADGGRVTRPTEALMGENYRPEIILPETKPTRAAQILANSPLGNILGGGPTTVIAYFDGEPFQARVVRTVNGVGKRNARMINQVPRSI